MRPRDYNGHTPDETPYLDAVRNALGYDPVPAPQVNEYMMWFNAGRSVGRLEQLADFGELTEAERDKILCLVMEFQNRPEAS